ncbi:MULTISPECIES: ABC transporter substrate-binding protein [unclassified Lacrimispora]|uniref:ABC transporter substrate-binding protein n=1 Tax=unclassified Lacrimispora TaxID=2719232 RepID=UPI0037705F2E
MKKNLKKLTALMMSAAMILSITGCQNASSNTTSGQTKNGSSTATGGEYIIGCPQPLTGTNAQPGECALNATKLAAKQINAEGGILGKQIKIVSYDDQGSPEESVKVASKLVQVDKCDAVIGSCISSCVLSSGPVYNEAGIPVFGTGTSPTWMKQGWDSVFRACQNNDFALPSVVKKLQELGVKKVAIFAGQDDAAVAGVKTMTGLCKEAGIEITTSESYVEGNTDFSGQVAKMINSGAEVMFISTFGPTQPMIAKQLRQFGFNGLCFTKDLYQVDALQVAGAASNGMAFAYPYLTYTNIEDCNDPFIKDFLKAYQDEYGTLPVSDCAYRAYDSMLVLKEAVKAAGTTDKAAVVKAVGTLKDVKTMAGMQDFTLGDGEGLHECNIFVIDNETYMTFDEWEGTEGYKAIMSGIGKQ